MALTLSFVQAAEKIFDLQEQYFSETMQADDKAKVGNYDLPKVKVSTNAWYRTANNTYVARYPGSAFMTITLKKAITNWAYLETKMYDVSRRGNIEAVTRFTSDNGSSIFLSISKDKISINGKSFDIKMSNDNTIYAISVEKKGDVLITSLNGKELLKASIKDFGNLAKTETAMPSWAYYNDNYYEQLRALEIYSR